jgi:hypothetical protein
VQAPGERHTCFYKGSGFVIGFAVPWTLKFEDALSRLCLKKSIQDWLFDHQANSGAFPEGIEISMYNTI